MRTLLAAFVAVLTLSLSPLVRAEDAKPATTPVVAPTTAPVVTPVKAELKDGTKVIIKGEEVFVIGKDSKETTAPDGTHELKDGKKLTIKGGKIVK